MNILLVQPKMNKRPMDTDLKTKMSPSMALLTLKNLTPLGNIVILLNENIENINFNIDVDLVGITVTVDVMERAAEISREFQKRDIPVVAGGIHITANPEQCIKYFNAICIGMAERVWAKIIDDRKQNMLQKIYDDNDNMLGSEIVSPDYKNSEKSYLYTNIISTGRGCPHKCDFCYNSCEHSTKYINRPVEDVIQDIRNMGSKHIMFIDDNFIGNPCWTRDFLFKIKNMGLKWNAAVTSYLLKFPDILDLMAETGCQSLFIGFESINEESLHSVNKQNKISEYEQLIEAIHQRGIMINASMVFGLDGDDIHVFQNTLNWLVRNKIETLTSHILTPYPGTNVYKRMSKAGLIDDHELSHYNTAHVVYKPVNMSKEQLKNGYLNMYKEFYSFKNIIKRYPIHKKQRKAYLLFNLFYRKFGKFTEFMSYIIPMNILGKFASRIAYK